MAYDRNKYARTGSGSTSGSSSSSQTGRSSSTLRSGKYQRGVGSENTANTSTTPQYSNRQNSYTPKISIAPTESVVTKDSQPSGGYAAYKKQKETQGRSSEPKSVPVYNAPTVSVPTTTNATEEFHYDTTPVSPNTAVASSQSYVPPASVIEPQGETIETYSKTANIFRVFSIVTGCLIVILSFIPFWITYGSEKHSPALILRFTTDGLGIAITVLVVLAIILQILNAVFQIKRIKGFRWIGVASAIMSVAMTLTTWIGMNATKNAILSAYEAGVNTGWDITGAGADATVGLFATGHPILGFLAGIFTGTVGALTLGSEPPPVPTILIALPIVVILIALFECVASILSGLKNRS